jgi:hypothetical protein
MILVAFRGETSNDRFGTVPSKAPRVLLSGLVAVFAMHIPLIARSDDAPQPTPSLKQIASEIRQSFDVVKGIHVKYTLHSELKQGADLKHAYDLGCWRDRVDYAFSGPGADRKRLTLLRWWEPTSETDLKPKAFRQSWLTFNGKQNQMLLASNVRLFGGQLRISPNDKLELDGANISVGEPFVQQFETGNVYMQSIGSPFYDGEALPVYWKIGEDDRQTTIAKGSFSLPGAFERRAYQVRRAMETVDGSPCWVVESPGQDILWLDPARHYALVRRDWYWAKGGPLMFRWVNSNFSEVAPGLHMPRSTRFEVMAHPSRGDNRVLFITSCDVSEIKVNDIPESLFDVTFPPGTLVVDNSRISDDQGNPTFVSYSIGATPAATELSLENAVQMYEQNRSSRGSRWALVGLNFAALAVLGALVWVRKHRLRNSSAHGPATT